MARGIAFTAFVLAALLAWAPVAGAQAGSTRLLDVPYLAQTEDLCGGAAVAMVLRYWGERQVYAEDFAALVDRSASGIHTDVRPGGMPTLPPPRPPRARAARGFAARSTRVDRLWPSSKWARTAITTSWS